MRPQQATLGASVLISRRHVEKFGELAAPEWTGLGEAVGEIERRLRETFRYEKINYLMLMMVDRHLHFHVLPRYSKAQEFGGVEWSDPGWPKAPDLSQSRPAVDAIAEALRRGA